MKKPFLILVPVLLMTILLGCGKEMDNPTSPTGYPSGEVQREFLFYQDQLYGNLNEGLKSIPDGLNYIGSVEKYDNKTVPDEEFEGCRALEIGTSLYAPEIDHPIKIYAETADGHIISLGRIKKDSQGKYIY